MYAVSSPHAILFPLSFNPNLRHSELLPSSLHTRAFEHPIPSALRIHKHSWPHSNWKSPQLIDHFLQEAAFTPQTNSCPSESLLTPPIPLLCEA